jgi:Zn-dependent protease
VIFHLGQPIVLLGMAIGLAVAVLVHNLAQAAVGRLLRDPVVRMSRRRILEPQREFDPFGIIAMVIGGVGWGKPVPLAEPRTRGGRKARFITALLSGPLADIVVGLACAAGYSAATSGFPLVSPRGSRIPVHPNAGYVLLGLVGVMCVAVGVLHVIPLPPLDGARLMWVLAPPTPGWQRARYNLEEQNYGLGALVVFSLPILGANEGLVVRVVYAMAQPVLNLVAHAF